MDAVTAGDVSGWTERESLYFYIGGAFRSATRHLTWLAFLPFLFLAVVVLAQRFPFSLRRTLAEVRPRLPYLEDPEVLSIARDSLRLAYTAGKFYSRFCLFSGAMRDVLVDIDETIDSLNFVIGNRDELNSMLDECAGRVTPDLPLRLVEIA